MKALVSRKPGGPETLVLEELPEPVVGPGQVRIVVRACAVNFPDLLIIQDLYQVKPERPFAPGSDVAGIVDAVGAGVENVRRQGDLFLVASDDERSENKNEYQGYAHANEHHSLHAANTRWHDSALLTTGSENSDTYGTACAESV